MTRTWAALAAGCSALALAMTFWGGCGRSEEAPDELKPSLSQPGSRWQVSRGDRVVMTLVNAPGEFRWSTGAVAHPFASGEASDPKEEPRLKQAVSRAHHFRDLVRRLERASYGVAEVQAPSPGP